MLKQPQYSPLPMEDQVVSIFACTPQESRPSWVRPLELEDIARYEKEMLDYVRTRHGRVLEVIRTSGKLEDETKKKLIVALDEFANVFVPTKRAGSQAA
jgi:F-type H+-transporting ATPase subunit alpha